jgi:hypothetical protein
MRVFASDKKHKKIDRKSRKIFRQWMEPTFLNKLLDNTVCCVSSSRSLPTASNSEYFSASRARIITVGRISHYFQLSTQL